MLAFLSERVSVGGCVFVSSLFFLFLFLNFQDYQHRGVGKYKKCYTEKRQGRREEKWGGEKYTLVKSPCGHCFSAPASASSMNDLSLHRHLKSLDWQPVEPMAERAGLCCTGEGGIELVFGFYFLEGIGL